MDKTKKEKLLGTVGKIPATHDHPIPIEKLNSPLPRGAVIRSFCQGCGIAIGLNLNDAIKYLSLLDEEPENISESFAGHYFYIGACSFCDSKKLYIELKPIPKLEKN
ncbi:MAG: hypothetical protein WCJ57_03510 [Candidatus Falkowbacteria bacterium]